MSIYYLSMPSPHMENEMTRPTEAQTLPMELPRCPSDDSHGYLELRPLSRQTPEQQWCGVWYDCLRCKSSVLFQSAQLQAQNDAARALGLTVLAA